MNNVAQTLHSCLETEIHHNLAWNCHEKLICKLTFWTLLVELKHTEAFSDNTTHTTCHAMSISVTGEIFTTWIPNSLVLWKTCLNLKIPCLHMKDSDRYDSRERPAWARAQVFLAIGWSLSWHQHLDWKSFQHDDFILKEPNGWGYTEENKTLASLVVFYEQLLWALVEFTGRQSWLLETGSSKDCWSR